MRCNMAKHIYYAEGITTIGGHRFFGECIAEDMMQAIQILRNQENKLSVHRIERRKQVSADKDIGVTYLRIFGRIYS